MFSHAIRHLSDTAPGALPYDAEVEYIESTGTQYIDTGFDFESSHNFTISLYFDLVKRRDPSENNYIFSCIDSSAWLSCEIDRVSPYRAYANIGTKTLIYCGPSPYPFNAWDVFTFSTDVNSQQYTIAGSNWSTSGTYTGTLPSGRINLLTSRKLTSTGSRPFVRIGYVKIWDNDTLVRDFVPVRVGAEYCLYDKANPTGGDNGDGLYHNKGTGAFSGSVDKSKAGTKFLVSRVMGSATGTIKPVLKHYDIATSYTIHECNGNTPTIVNANFPSGKYDALDYTPVWGHHRFVGWTTKPPYDAEIEYLESTGTQFIKTGITQADDLTIECTFQKTGSTATWGTYFGCGYSDNSAYNILGRHYSTTPTDFNPWFANTTYGECRVPVSTSSMNTVVVKAGSCVKDGTSYTISTVTGRLSSYEIYLFTANKDNTSWRPQPCRISRFMIKRGSTTLADYIPVRVGTVGCMYDKVSGGILSNAGTGDFVKGGDTKVVSGNSISPSDDIIYDIKDIYATWQLPTTVTFDATTNGGQMPSGWIAPDYYEGQPYGTLPKPTKSDEVFLGWFTSNGTRITESSIVATGTLTARYAAVTWGTTYSCTTTSSYKKTGIYSANRYSSSDPIVVDWGDGTIDVVYGNISQLAHTYPSATTYTVKISDNISTFCPSYGNSTWYQTTSQNRYTFKKVLTLSSKVTQLSQYAFYYCSAMTDAIIPSGATSIPNYCFYYCSQLKSSSVQLPSTVTSVGAHAFDYCTSSNFNSITIPGACTSIGSYAFECCYYLRPVFESGSATLTLNTYSFSYCGYSGSAFTIDLSPRKITSIPNYCFYYCRYLKGITWPQGLTSIGGSAFRYCFYYAASTGTVEIPEGVTSISSTYAFGNCLYLTAVTLPRTLTNLNNYTFYNCTRLATITSNRSTAPTVSSATFGNSTTYYTGRTSYSAGTNKLRVPAGATGYNASYWSSVLLNSTKCGFTLEEMP